jgi:hypothetical protein
MSTRRYHSVSHGRLVVDIDDPLTEAEKLKVKIETLEMILKSIDRNRCPNFHATVKAQLEDAKSEAKTVRDAITDDSEPIQPHYIVTEAWAEKHLNSTADIEKMGDGKTEISDHGYKPV